MKKILLIIAMVISLFSSEYKVDKDYSSIKFEVSKMLFVSVNGEFSQFNGTIKLDKDNKLSQINGLITIDSINTKDVQRDEHLKEHDYFHILKFPNIVFRSNTIIDNILKAKVNIKGIEKELDFKISDFELNKNSVTLTLSSTINRQDFMLNGSMSAVISDNVDVTAIIHATKIR